MSEVKEKKPSLKTPLSIAGNIKLCVRSISKGVKYSFKYYFSL